MFLWTNHCHWTLFQITKNNTGALLIDYRIPSPYWRASNYQTAQTKLAHVSVCSHRQYSNLMQQKSWPNSKDGISAIRSVFTSFPKQLVNADIWQWPTLSLRSLWTQIQLKDVYIKIHGVIKTYSSQHSLSICSCIIFIIMQFTDTKVTSHGYHF